MNFFSSRLNPFSSRGEKVEGDQQSAQALAQQSALAPERETGELLSQARAIADQQLSPLVTAIDADGLYPEDVMRAYGKAGAFAQHVPNGEGEKPDITTSVEIMSIAGEQCLSTAFCMWCQNALAWYIYNSDNDAVKTELGARVASGVQLGGTGLSNPMKNFFGIERLKLKAERADGGYYVTGVLPWVSNLGPDHMFAIVFGVPESNDKRVMAVVDCAGEGVRLAENDHFVALEGTRTYTIQLRKAFIPDGRILADPIDDYLLKIRAGFILLQGGMAFGMVRSCIDLMEQTKPSLGHVNKYLPDQPEHFREKLDALESKVTRLAAIPYETSKDYFIEVVRARLEAGELAVASAHNAMLHCGASGYVSHGAAQRRLREAYFCAIVTPATKQLRKMLDDLGAPATAMAH